MTDKQIKKSGNKDGESRPVDVVVMPHFSYDNEADVMYINFGEILPCETKEIDDGLLHRYSGKRLNGITIIGYGKRVT